MEPHGATMSEQLLSEAMRGLPTMVGVPRPGGDSLNGSPYSSLTQARLEIVEQPKQRGFRFRYDCEGQSHGGLPGENSEKNRKQKTYPTVRLVGYRGRARVMVSLVTENDPPTPHAHSIVGKNAQDGRCIVEIGQETDMYAQFPNLGILHVTKKKVPDILTHRLIQQVSLTGQTTVEQMETDQPQLSDKEMEHIRQEAIGLSKSMNLSVVRLAFNAFLPDENGRFTIPVEPAFSHKVYDSKAPSAGTLKVCRLDKTSGSVRGGDDVFLLCDKVQKNDIEVIFYEDKNDAMNVQPWMAKGRFGPNDVHHQYAVVFQTPAFYNQAIEHPVQVWIALRRPSDHETSEPKPFLYLPIEFDEERIGHKRRKKISHFNNFFDGAGGAGGGFFKDFGGGGAGGGGGDYMGGGGGGAAGGSGYSSSYNFFQGGGGGAAGGGGQGGGTMTTRPVNPYPTSTMDSFSLQPEPTPPVTAPYSQPLLSQGMMQPSYFAAAANPNQYPSAAVLPNQQFMAPRQPQFGGYQQQQPLGYGMFVSAASGHGYQHRSNGDGSTIPHIKTEPPDWSDVERDNPSPGQNLGGLRPAVRPGAPGQSKSSMIDPENEESGFVEQSERLDSERLDSGLPASIATEPAQSSSREQASEIEAQQAMQSLQDRQQMAFEVCDRMFNALLAWATTKDVRYLLAAQRSLTAVQNQEGDTVLHLAIIHNHQDVVLQLLDVLPQLPPTETPVVDCLNNFKQSPLHLAVITRQQKVIQYLLKANANPLVCDRNGDTPLHLACKYGFLPGIEPFITRTTRINSEGCRIPELSMRNNDGHTPLHLAATCGNPECLRRLVKGKADVDVQDSKSGKTALHYLIERGDLPLTGFLVTEGEANTDCTDYSGNTALHCAAAQGNIAIVSLLLAAGADLTVQNQEGETPLQMAELSNHVEVVKILRDAMRGIEKPDEQLTSKLRSVSLEEQMVAPPEGDLASLGFRPRFSLAFFLDQLKEGGDWRALARRLDLGHLINGLQAMTSPTKELLTMYEACDGTVKGLHQALLDIGRTDAVAVIDRFLQDEAARAQASSSGTQTKPHLSSAAYDSGISSSIASQESGPSNSMGSPLPHQQTTPTHTTTQA